MLRGRSSQINPPLNSLPYPLEVLKLLEHNGTATYSYSHAVDGE